MQVSKITPGEVRQWITDLATGDTPLSGAQIRHYHALLAKILDVAVEERMIPSNPARGVKLPRKSKPVKVYLSASQLKKLADECLRHGELVWVLGTTGLRWGEATGLKVSDIDMVRGRITVSRSIQYLKGELVVGSPKTHEKRVVAVPRQVLDILQAHIESQGLGFDDWIWTSSDGKPLRTLKHTSWFYQAVKRLHKRDPSFPVLTPHGLRHVAAGLMVSAGANVKVVQRQLGHKSAAMTLDTYADLFEDDLDTVSAALDGLLGI